MKDLMIDIETLGKGPRAAILSIGAVFFDLSTGRTGDEFYVCIDPKDAETFGTVDASTRAWWNRQGEAARREAYGGKTPARVAVSAFHAFVAAKLNVVKPWGNGSIFDITILEHAFSAHGFGLPWHFYNVRDVRTIVDLGERLVDGRHKNTIKFEGVAHSALDDARHQVRYCHAYYNHMAEALR